MRCGKRAINKKGAKPGAEERGTISGKGGREGEGLKEGKAGMGGKSGKRTMWENRSAGGYLARKCVESGARAGEVR